MIVLLLIPISHNAFAETVKVEIPSGSSTPLASVHFLPEEVSVRPGDKVQWGNTDSAHHTVTSGTLLSGPTGLFDSGFLKPGDRFEVLFGEPEIGETKYFCTIHPWMIGIVNVVDLDREFQIYHNVGSEVSASPVDIAYKVQRNLVSVEVDPSRDMLLFNFAGMVNNDVFVVRLPEELIKNPESVWRNDKQITDYELKKQDGVSTLTVPLMEGTEQLKIAGTEVIGKPVQKEQVLINQILAITDKKFYEKGEEIVVSGEIRNPVQLYQISLDVSSPKGVGAYHKEIPLVNATRFTETIPTIGVLREFGEYSVKITAPSAKSSFMTFEYGIGPKEYDSPRKQMKSGVPAKEVECNEGFDLLKKVSNGRAVCLSESTANVLLERGWAQYF
jgi:plastocyanin